MRGEKEDRGCVSAIRRPSSLDGFGGWGVLLGVPALFVIAYVYPRIGALSELPACAVRHFLGFPCPGCGLTTSFINLVHGGVRQSIDAHPLGVIAAAYLAYEFGRSIYAVIAGRPPRELLTQGERNLLLYVFLAALVANWMLRFVPL